MPPYPPPPFFFPYFLLFLFPRRVVGGLWGGSHVGQFPGRNTPMRNGMVGMKFFSFRLEESDKILRWYLEVMEPLSPIGDYLDIPWSPVVCVSWHRNPAVKLGQFQKTSKQTKKDFIWNTILENWDHMKSWSSSLLVLFRATKWFQSLNWEPDEHKERVQGFPFWSLYYLFESISSWSRSVETLVHTAHVWLSAETSMRWDGSLHWRNTSGEFVVDYFHCLFFDGKSSQPY